MKLSACLIVKNEKDHIRAVLESLEGVDEIIVCDTGSTDETVALAREYTENVFTDYVWADDFAAARNHAKSKATGDWIISIDADETLEHGGVQKIRDLIANATEDQLHFSVRMTSKVGGQVHDLPRIFRNNRIVEWVGAAHETVHPVQKNPCDIVITYGYSTAHDLDPDRMLRILSKIVASGNATPRDRYYHAREAYYRKAYARAAVLFEEYTKVATWNPEKADAFLYIARCYWYTGQGDKARAAGFKAFEINPDFKENLLFLADMHFEPWKHKFLRLAEVAQNEDVLFKRV